ncbi:MAG: hypothetical protein E7231_12895 [Cellulosilyticum sp.]|nr:hypothetical protein [Cellulosilyticum sp.]
MTILLVILIIGVIVYWKIPYSIHKKIFLDSMEKRLIHTKMTSAVCSSEEIDKLPEAMQRFCKYVGLEGTKKINAVRATFKNTKFIFDDQKEKVLDMNYDLWLFATPWYRSAFCMATMYGIPFEGQDYCTDNGTGGMKGYLGRSIKIFETCDTETYRAGLISWMVEGIILSPSFILSPYLKFEEMDRSHVKATITYNGITGTGIFTIAQDGAMTEFYSDERQIEMINGVKSRIGWRCEIDQYEMVDHLKIPQSVRSIKVYPDKEVVYFDASEIDIIYY